MQNKFVLTEKFNDTINFYYLSVFLIMAFAAWLFWHGINGEFLFDDWQVLLQTDFVRNHSAWFAGYRPIRNLSYVIDLLFGALKPFTFHLSNLIYHLINTLLVFSFLNLFITPVSIFEKIWVTGIVAVFAVHPVQVESVVYISGRRDLLFTMFYLLGIIIFLKLIKGRETDSSTIGIYPGAQSKRLKWAWVWVLIFTVCSTLSKEAGITLPVFCFILQRYFYGKWTKIKLKHLIILFLLLTVLAFYSISMAMPSLSAGYMGGSFFTHIENCSYFLFKYIKIAFYPVHLAADYSDFSLKFIKNPASLKGIVSLLGAVSITFFSLVVILRRTIQSFSLFAFGWLWLVITILPMSNIVPHVERFALHYLYLPLIGIFLALWGLYSVVSDIIVKVIEKWREPVFLPWFSIFITICFFCGFVAFLSLRTKSEIKWWKDDVRFWKHNTMVNPRCARAQANLGTALIRAGRFKKAETALAKALAIKNLPQAFLGMASIAMDEKNYDKAENFLGHVPANSVKFDKQRLFLLGMAVLGKGNIANARVYADVLRRKWPGFDGGCFLKGKIEMELAEYKKAILSFKQAVVICPFDQQNYVEIVRAFAGNKEFGRAMLYLEQGFKNRVWNKNNPYRLNDLGYMAELTGMDDKAVDSYEAAVNSDHGCIIAGLNLSHILLRKKKFDQVVKLAQKIVLPDFHAVDKADRIDNAGVIESSNFMNNVGIAFIMLGQKDKGKKAFEKALKLWPDNKMAIRNLGRVR